MSSKQWNKKASHGCESSLAGVKSSCKAKSKSQLAGAKSGGKRSPLYGTDTSESPHAGSIFGTFNFLVFAHGAA